MPRLAAHIDPRRLFWRCAVEWYPSDWEREDGLRVSVHNWQGRSSVAIHRGGRRTTEADIADVEHLLDLPAGALRRRTVMNGECDGPPLPVLSWLEIGVFHRPQSQVETPPAPTRIEVPECVLRWQVDPLRLMAHCEACELRTELGFWAMPPPAPWDFEDRARNAEQLARERLLQNERWQGCQHLRTARVNTVALHLRYDRKPPPRPSLVLPDRKRSGPAKEWYQQARR